MALLLKKTTPQNLCWMILLILFKKKETADGSPTSNHFLLQWHGYLFLHSRFFKLCPKVIFCDVTSHSNNKGFRLYNFSCRTSIGKQVIFLWVFVPNEQQFSFWWVFQFVIPTLIQKCTCDCVIFIMKDRDHQPRNLIFSYVIKIFPNASGGSCGFYIGMCK